LISDLNGVIKVLSTNDLLHIFCKCKGSFKVKLS